MHSQAASRSSDSEHLPGIDYLRSLMSVLVVFWHLGGAGRSSIFSAEGFETHSWGRSDAFNFHVLMLAVPVFVLVASFLQAQRPTTTTALWGRLQRLVLLATFWPTMYLMIMGDEAWLQRLEHPSLTDLLRLVLTAGGTVYYFFICLIFTTLLTHFAVKLKRRNQVRGLLVAMLAICLLPWATRATGIGAWSAYWNPLNFLPYPFAGALLAGHLGIVRRNWISFAAISVALASFLSVLEWHLLVDAAFFRGQECAIPVYTRLSLLFASVALLLPALNSHILPRRPIVFMSSNSLPLYCLHPFLLASALVGGRIVLPVQPGGDWIALLIAILGSYLLAAVLRSYLKPEIIG